MFIRWWYSFWIKLAYKLGLRRWANNRQRALTGENKDQRVDKLLEVATPGEIRAYAKHHNYKWRKDATRIGGKAWPLDWVSEPEVFQWRLEQDPFPEGDGDCDDYHAWYAACLTKVPNVDKVILCSTGYPGGGHTTCAFKYKGDWFHVNYSVAKINDPNDIPRIVAEWGTDAPKEPKVLWYVFEDLDFNALAIGPKGRIEA